MIFNIIYNWIEKYYPELFDYFEDEEDEDEEDEDEEEQ